MLDSRHGFIQSLEANTVTPYYNIMRIYYKAIFFFFFFIIIIIIIIIIIGIPVCSLTSVFFHCERCKNRQDFSYGESWG
jgi:hypothetical protein